MVAVAEPKRRTEKVTVLNNMMIEGLLMNGRINKSRKNRKQEREVDFVDRPAAV